jgi:hypothetical protein
MIFVITGLGLNLLTTLPKIKWMSFVVCLFLLVVGVPQPSTYLKAVGGENIRPIVNALEESYTNGDRIYVYYSTIPAFTYYYHDYLEALVFGTSHRGAPEGYYREINTVLKSGSRVWLVFSHCYGDECRIIPKRYSSQYEV